MGAEIRRCRDLGADGVAIGCLRPDGTVDGDALAVLVAAARPMAVTFHRAIDRTPDLAAGLEVLVACGVDHVLTSGGAATAADGIAGLARLVARARGRIGIIAAGTVRAGNAARVAASGADALHFSEHMVPVGATGRVAALVREIARLRAAVAGGSAAGG